MRAGRRRFLELSGGAAALFATGCRSSKPQVVVYTSVDQPFSDPVLRGFERSAGVTVKSVFDTEETKSTGVMNRLLAEANHPQADVFWSGDPVRPFLLQRRGLLERYVSPQAAAIPAAFKAPDGAWTGFAARARVLLVHRTLVGGERPTSIRDLTGARWKGKTAIANPLFGTTTMHVGALFSAWGDDAARAFMAALKQAGVRIASSNGEVKRLVMAGEVAFGLTDTDDANEARKADAPVDIVYPDQDGLGTLVMPTTVVLLRGGPNPEPARRLVDHLLSADVERQMAEVAAHMPLRADVSPPAGVEPVAAIRAMQVDYADVADRIDKNQAWLRTWAGL